METMVLLSSGFVPKSPLLFGSSRRCKTRIASTPRRYQTQAFFDFREDPILKEALKEPVAFLGGLFAGILRLDLKEEPLKSWIEKTAESAGVKAQLPEAETEEPDGPEEIQIE